MKVKRVICGALIIALLFVGSRFHLRTMDVIFIHEPTESATLIDCNEDTFVIFADEVAVNDRLYCLTYGEGSETVILNYVKEDNHEKK